MRVHCFDNLSELRAIEGQWHDLLGRSNGNAEIFLTPEWIFNWFECFGEGMQPVVLAVQDGKDLAGLAPLALRSQRILGWPYRALRFGGSNHADHLDFCVDPTKREGAVSAIVRYLTSDVPWDVLDFADIPDDSANLPILEQCLEEHGIPYRIQPSIVCPYLPLNGESWTEFYAGKRSKSTRKDLKRRLRRLSDLGQVEFRRYEDPSAIAEIFPQLFEVYGKRWEGKNLSVSFVGDKERDFYPKMAMALAANKRLHLLTLEQDGKVVAFSLSAMKGPQFTWLVTAYDPEYHKFFPGEQILVQLLEDVFERHRFKEFDFTRGDEAYKFKWTDQHRWNLRILAHNRRFFSRIPYRLLGWYASFRREAKKSAFLRKVKLDAAGSIRRLWNGNR